MKITESVNDYFGRVMEITNDMINCKENMNDVKIVENIIRSMTENINFVVCSIEESKDIDLLNMDELKSSLLVHEKKVREKQSEEQVLQVKHDMHYRRGKGKSNSQRGSKSYVRGGGRAKPFVNRSDIICY